MVGHMMFGCMDGLRPINHRVTALVVAAVLVLSGTLLPTLAFAQKYADHLSNYGGHPSRMAALGAFADLYADPRAAMLPVVLAADAGAADALLPSGCIVEKLVFTRAPQAAVPEGRTRDRAAALPRPTGLHPDATTGPPRRDA